MKSPEMERTLDVLSKHIFGRSRLDCFEQRRCVTCGHTAIAFMMFLFLFNVYNVCRSADDEGKDLKEHRR